MNKIYFFSFRSKIISILFSSMLIFSVHSMAQCNAKSVMKACKPNVQKPYKYDSYVISELKFDKKPKVVEVVFTAFEGQKYRLIFCTNGFEEPVKLNIYNKNKSIKQGRKKLYDNEEGIDNNFWTFEPPKSGNYFIDYEVPVSNDGKPKIGCVILLIGYIQQK
jgi:hypothetical protein